jgi:sugar phosphate isomerase/epimerase
MKLGVAGLLPEWQKIDLAVAKNVRAAGFQGVSVFFSRPLEADLAEVGRIKAAMDEAGLEAAQANGWYECLVNPYDDLRAAGVRGMQALIRIGRRLDACTVYVRPGSLNPQGAWYPHPGNHTRATFDHLTDSLRQVSATAQAEGMTLAIEGHVLSPLDSARKMRELLDAVASPALKFNVDMVNFIGSVMDVHDTTRVINEVFDLLGKDTVAAHMKDCALEDELVLHIKEVVMGTGTMDLGLILRRMAADCPNIYCLVEHLPDHLVPQARAALVAVAEREGILLEC